MRGVFKSIAVAVLVAGTVLPGVAAAADVLLRSVGRDAYVRQERGVLVANGGERGAERLEVVPLQGNRVALRARDGYVGVEGPRDALVVGGRRIRVGEMFELVRTRNDRVHLRSIETGRFVAPDRRGLLSATALDRSDLTAFRIEQAGRPDGGPRPPRGDEPPRRVEWTGEWGFLRLAGPDGRFLPVPREARVQFSVGRDMRVSMSVGCNRIGAQLRTEGPNQANFTQAFSTRMMCQGPLGRYERTLLDALGQVARYEYREGQIAFLDRRGRTLLQIGR